MNKATNINYFILNEIELYNIINSRFSLFEDFITNNTIEKYNIVQHINRSFNKYSFWNTFINYLNYKTELFIRDNTIEKNMCKVICNKNMYKNALHKNYKYYNEYLQMISLLQNL
jgi:hypothetical protein